MALNISQQSLLEICGLSVEIQQFLGRELGENGQARAPDAPDFLDILSNMLQISENRLHNLRFKLGRATKFNDRQSIVSEAPPEVVVLEEEIKQAWNQALALWRATNQVVHHPDDFAVEVNVKHVHHALMKRNLPVVEMIRSAKPEFFEIKSVTPFGQYSIGFLGSLFGAVVGLWGGCTGGIRQVERSPFRIQKFWVPLYALAGIFSGSAMGAIVGGSMGFQTGNLKVAVELGYEASYLNPFHDSRGSKYQQAVQIRREEVLFELARAHEIAKINMRNNISAGTI